MRSFRTGQWVILGKELARSGQGVIYRTETPGVLAKIYKSHEDLERAAKLQCMLENPPADPTRDSLGHTSIAWPQDLVIDRNGHCVGLLMPQIMEGCELTKLYNPTLRVNFAPLFNWYYLHSTALNYASALESVHAAGHVVGDIKPQNVLVNPKALISIIDTDSFQVRDPQTGRLFRCPVGSEGFTARELLEQLGGGGFSEVDRDEFHDRFGLGVIIYFLLLFGRHPFSEGRYFGGGDPPSPDERVRRGLWLHSGRAEIAPDPTTIDINIVHPQLAALFLRCFNDGHHDPAARPGAREWRLALDVATMDLQTCSEEPNHRYSATRGVCLWCLRRELVGVDIFATQPRPRPPPQPRDLIESAGPYTIQPPTTRTGTYAIPRRRPAVPTLKPKPASNSYGCVSWIGIWFIIWFAAQGLESCSSGSTPGIRSRSQNSFRATEEKRPVPRVPEPPARPSPTPTESRGQTIESQILEEERIKRALSEDKIPFGYNRLLVTDQKAELHNVYYPNSYGTRIFTYVKPVHFKGMIYKKDLGKRTTTIVFDMMQFKYDQSWAIIFE